MIKKALNHGQLYINYLGPLSASLGNFIATPILILNLGLKGWSLFALINILLPLVYLILFGNAEIAKRLMINVLLGNKKTEKSIKIFYEFEKKLIKRLIPAIIILSITLTIFNSDKYISYVSIELTFILISIAIFIKIFEFYYAEILNGLKEHYKLQVYAFIVTILKWCSIISISYLSEININFILLTVIIFSFFLMTILRLVILDTFKKKVQKISQNNETISLSNDSNFGIIILSLLLIQQFDKVLAFGILEPLTLSYFAIALMICSAIYYIVLPVGLYLTPEIYEAVELNKKNRNKKYFKLIIIQFIILLSLLTISNLYLGPILIFWLGKNIDIIAVSSFLMPLTIITLSFSLLNSIKIFLIAENKLKLMKKPLVITFCILLFLVLIVYFKFLTSQIYLYLYSFLIFFVTIYLCYKIFLKKLFIN
jgi:O-antigen/teichoic acid export membrane protein